MIPAENIKWILALKLRQLRAAKGYSATMLAKKSGISTSYLAEIEKGKKRPTPQKIMALAKALEVDYDEIVSLKLSEELTPIANLLTSNFLNELPLQLFGIGLEQLMDIIADAPDKVSAFISMLIQVARNYEIQTDHFFKIALRSYQEMYNNFFEDIERDAANFKEEYSILLKDVITEGSLVQILEQQYHYCIDQQRLGAEKKLQGIRSLYKLEDEQPILMLNSNLNTSQKNFQLAKEIAYNHLGLQRKGGLPPSLKIDSFEQLLHNAKASYFAGALLVDRNKVLDDIDRVFSKDVWDGALFLKVMNGYNVSPETFLHRLTNLLPHYFRLNHLFFLRFTHTRKSPQYHITKELHLADLHNPHGNEINEHYCRRWITINILKELEQLQEKQDEQGPIVRVQRSRYWNSKREYFCITLARAMHPTPQTNSSVTIGFLVDRNFKEKVNFWDDPAVPVRWVNETCERCGIEDCQERVAAPTVLEKQEKINELEQAVRSVLEEASIIKTD